MTCQLLHGKEKNHLELVSCFNKKKSLKKSGKLEGNLRVKLEGKSLKKSGNFELCCRREF